VIGCLTKNDEARTGVRPSFGKLIALEMQIVP